MGDWGWVVSEGLVWADWEEDQMSGTCMLSRVPIGEVVMPVDADGGKLICLVGLNYFLLLVSTRGSLEQTLGGMTMESGIAL